jgi:hypothetical protein
MRNSPPLSPKMLSEEAMFTARTTKVSFVNPKGYERARSPSVAASNDEFRDPCHKEREARFGTQGYRDGFAVKNRPLT